MIVKFKLQYRCHRWPQFTLHIFVHYHSQSRNESRKSEEHGARQSRRRQVGIPKQLCWARVMNPIFMLPQGFSGGGPSWVFTPLSEMSPLVFRVSAFIVESPSFPTWTRGTVQGVWLKLGPVLFLTCTLRKSSHECLNRGHETLHDAPRCPETFRWNQGPSDSNHCNFYLCFFYHFLFLEMWSGPRAEKLGRRRKSKDPVELPCGKLLWTRPPQIKTSIPSLTCSLVANFALYFQGI